MRIAIDAMLLGGKHSGVEVAIEGLCRAMPAAAPEHAFLVAHRKLYDNAPLRAPGIAMRCAPCWANCRPGRILYEQFLLPRVGRRWGADLLHAPGYVLPRNWHGPSVLTVYDVLALTHPQWCKWANAVHFKAMVPRSTRRADAVVVPSDAVADQLAQTTGINRGKIHVVYLGIGDDMRPAPKSAVDALKHALQLPDRYILWVGNIEPKKNIPGMVRGFELAAHKLPHHLVIAGKVGWKASESLRAIEASTVAHRIRRIGYVPHGALPALYSGADMLLHWSLHEGAGLTPLEAMACGTPAIVSDAGALPEIAGQKATVVRLGSPRKLADALVEMLMERGRKQGAIEDTRIWAQEFTWIKYARRIVQIYQQVASIDGETKTQKA